MTDAYKAAAAAQVLRCSERLVRKMAADGRLTVVGTNPLRVSQESVHQQRAKRPRPPKTEQPQAPTAAQIQEMLERVAAETAARVVAEMSAPMIESRNQVEARLAAELAQAQQERDQLRAELEELRNQSGGIKLPPIGWPFRR